MVKKTASKKTAKPRRSVAPSRPVSSVPVPVASVPTGVARSGSRNVSRSGPQNVAASNNNQIIEQELQDRLDRHKAKIGKLNFSLRWWDPNDLDLHVVCPCNT